MLCKHEQPMRQCGVPEHLPRSHIMIRVFAGQMVCSRPITQIRTTANLTFDKRMSSIF